MVPGRRRATDTTAPGSGGRLESLAASGAASLAPDRSVRDNGCMADDEDDGVGDAVCWLAATCEACGALVEGATCWNCGAPRTMRT